MNRWNRGQWPRRLAGLLVLLMSALSLPALAGSAPPLAAPACEALDGTPLEVRSREEAGRLVAEIRGVLDYPLARLATTLGDPSSWCDFIPLVFNVKSCVVRKQDDLELLTIYLGGKAFQAPQEALRLDYAFRVEQREHDRFRVLLTAPQGPWGTSDYRIELQAEASGAGRTAVRLHSSFRPSWRSAAATSAYLATAGRSKVGFSVENQASDGPVYVGGVQGIVERNVMRYYLALRAFLDTLQLPEGGRFESRLQAWYSATERYHRQLHEMEREEYLNIKRRERRHQLQLQQGLG